MSAPTSNLPLDDRSDAIKYSYPFLALVSTSFVALRVGNNIRNKKYYNVSDLLLVFAQACALVGSTFGYMCAWVGAGKHAWDPSVTPQDIAKYLQYLWFAQTFNLTSMAALKFSICAFMLQLDFSKTFRMLIWVSVVVHAGFNVVFPYIIVFVECGPIAKHWDNALPGYCWGPKARLVSGYCGAASNIVSDLFYTCAPLIYTAKVQLPPRVMWGVRVVFLLGFITTVISGVKLYEIKALSESKDVAYESVNLSILSVSEVLVGSLTASLPPLRRLFENFLNRILSESVMGTNRRTMGNSYVLPDYDSKTNTRRVKQEEHESDDSSEKTILPDAAGSNAHIVEGKAGEIMRTTHVSLTVDDTKPHSRNEDWA
ncbi:uncharacterized protein EKO05_0005837 [Ascochyta rabiei]|uniref:Uncharacterized protein n=1 Tax=Didymella rabiei TaxID=5454 RepID=A0A163LVK5_DIDRA|nr:uncharacterized protein EKO05_0005837 [Ascochyta rabiei]KZM28161.1 hypothetical protein ST47_g697 [Ascochyta rabiei]UPX15390.1 hypothetical protein EKO05_0005837 [Ascochyta rabiei]